MTPLVEDRLDDLRRLCQARHVRTLSLFGSAAEDRFDTASSDLDFLVEFQEPTPGRLSDAYFGLLEDLTTLFRRPVDLVMASAVRNRYFRQQLEATKVPLYAAAG